MQTTTKKVTIKQKVAFLREQLATSDAWALKALLRIYAEQTNAEKAASTTSEDNGVGFTGLDAAFLTSLAKQYGVRGSLSPKQMVFLHKKIVKYAGQLLRFSDPAKIESLVLKRFQTPVAATTPTPAMLSA